MKTSLWILILMIVGYVCFKPKQPRDYPPVEVAQQKESIIYKETKLDRLLKTLTYEIKKDSIELQHIKSN